MAFDYSLDTVSGLLPDQALKLLAKELNLEWGDTEHLVGQGVWISVVSISEMRQSIFEEAFNFNPTISVGFRLNPNSDDYEKGNLTMFRATMILLQKEAGDAVLLFNGENIILQRIKGEITVNEDWSKYDIFNLISEITLPYKIRVLPSPLL